MTRLAAPMALILASLMMAGCLETPGDAAGDALPDLGLPVDPYEAIRALLADVPCQVPNVGAATTDNLLHLVNRTAESGGTYGELDISGDLLLWAAYGAGGFDILDMSDPMAPVLLGAYQPEQSRTAYDVKISPDNTTAFVGRGGGVEIVDIRDGAEPVQTGFWSFPAARPHETFRNAHMLYTMRIAEADWLFIAPNANSGVHILAIEGEPGHVELRKVAETLPVQGGPLGPHDMWVGKDAFTGRHILYSADGFEGWSAWDVEDPRDPTLLARVLNLEPYQGYTHTIQAAKVGDRRLVVTIAEVGHNALKVYDATDFRLPLLLGTWQAAPAADPLAPQHNLQIVDGKVFVAHYGRGFYVFDLTHVPAIPLTGVAQLSPMAHWTRNPDATQGPLGFNGMWDVAVRDGLVYISDVREMRVLGFGCFEPGEAALTSTG